jgi:U3 small nucleolar RNA-associated protein 14
VRFAEVDLNENEEDLQPNGRSCSDEESDEEEEGDDDEFINLLDVLDGKGDIDMGSDNDTTPKKKAAVSHTDSAEQDGPELEQDEESGEDDSEVESDKGLAAAEDEEMAFAPSEDDEAPEALDQLQQFVSGLDVISKKRKAPEDFSATLNTEGRERKRRHMKERTEAGDENEFRAHSSGEQ